MSARTVALLAGLAAGVACYALAYLGADWSHTEAGPTAVFWAAAVYTITRMCDEPWWPRFRGRSGE